MSLPVWCEIVCDTCAQPANGMWSCNGRVPLRALVAQAKRQGFQVEGNEVLCAKCKPKEEKKP